MTKIFMQVTKGLIYIYQIGIYWTENEKNGLNNEKKFKVKILYFKFEFRQLGFQCTYELHSYNLQDTLFIIRP
jgi:hypothetical protein